MAITLKKCGSEDLADLQAIGIETFTDTFAAHNTPEDRRLTWIKPTIRKS